MKDNLSIGVIPEIVNKSKIAVHGILKVYNNFGSSEASLAEPISMSTPHMIYV